MPSTPPTMFIGGEWVSAHSGATTTLHSPFDGAPVGIVPKANREDTRRAVDAAREAFDKGTWPRLPPRARGEVFLKAAQILTQRLVPIAELESRNQGKTIKQAADADLPFSIDNLDLLRGGRPNDRGEEPRGVHGRRDDDLPARAHRRRRPRSLRGTTRS